MAWDTYAGSGEHLRPDVNILFAYVYNKIVGFTIMRYGDEDAHLLDVARREAIWKEGTTVDYGAHLPVIDFGFYEFSLERLCAYVRAARDLGFKAVSTNDHLIHSRPWLDAPNALAVILSDSGSVGFTGRFYSTAGIDLEPKPLQKPSPPIWIGSWGSDAGLRRVARLGDGWLVSAYNTMPDQFAGALAKLRDQLKIFGKARHASRTRWQQCSCTSPKASPRPSGFCLKRSRRC